MPRFSVWTYRDEMGRYWYSVIDNGYPNCPAMYDHQVGISFSDQAKAATVCLLLNREWEEFLKNP